MVHTFGLPITLLIFAVLAFWRGWVVPGWLYADLRAEVRELRRVLYGSARVAERTARVTERAVDALARTKQPHTHGADDAPEA